MTRHKYGAKPIDGYASTLERDRARELRLLAQAGEIRELVEQPRVELLPGLFYKPDMTYIEGDGTHIWEEVKGVETPRWRVVAKLWRFWGPGPLRVVKRGRQGFVVVREIVPRYLHCADCGHTLRPGCVSAR